MKLNSKRFLFSTSVLVTCSLAPTILGLYDENENDPTFQEYNRQVLMRDGNCGIYDAELNLIKNVGNLDVHYVAFGDRSFRFSNGRHEGIMNSDGNILIPPIYSINGVDGFEDGFPAGSNDKWGILDIHGNWLAAPIFEMTLEPDSFGTFWAKTERGYGLRDFEGKWQIPPQFNDARIFDHNGIAWVQSGEKYGLINRSGSFLIAPKYYHIDYSDSDAFDKNGFAIVQVSSMDNHPFQYQLIDRNGEPIFDRTWLGIRAITQNDDSIIYFFFGEDASLMLDKDAKVVSPANEAFSPPSGGENIFRFIRNGKVGFMKLDGTVLIAPRFDGALDFDNYPLAKVWKNERWLIIDRTGRVRYRAPRMTEIDQFGTHFIVIKRGDKFAAVNYNGKIVLPMVYDDIGLLTEDGLFRITLDNKLGIIDKNSNFILPISIPLEVAGTGGVFFEMAENSIFPKSPMPGSGVWDGDGYTPYSVLRSHFDSSGWAWLKKNGKWGRIDKSGTTIYPFVFDQVDCY